jgi:hypothetical protein
MRKVVGVVLGGVALAIVVAAALGSAPFLVTPTPWVVGLIGVAMLAVVAQPSAAPSARRAAKVLTLVGSLAALVAWAAYLRGFSDDNGIGGWPDALDSMVDVGSSTAALTLAALLVVAGSATSRGQDDAEASPITADA